MITGIYVLPEFSPFCETSIKSYQTKLVRLTKKFVESAKHGVTLNGFEFNKKITSSKNVVYTAVGFALLGTYIAHSYHVSTGLGIFAWSCFDLVWRNKAQ